MWADISTFNLFFVVWISISFPIEILMCWTVGCCPRSHWGHCHMVHAFYYPAKIGTFLNSETHPALIILQKGLWTWTVPFNLPNQMFQKSDNSENVTGGHAFLLLPSTACYLDDKEDRQPLHDPWMGGSPEVLYRTDSTLPTPGSGRWSSKSKSCKYIRIFLKQHTTLHYCGFTVIINRNRFRAYSFCIHHMWEKPNQRSQSKTCTPLTFRLYLSHLLQMSGRGQCLEGNSHR